MDNRQCYLACYSSGPILVAKARAFENACLAGTIIASLFEHSALMPERSAVRRLMTGISAAQMVNRKASICAAARGRGPTAREPLTEGGLEKPRLDGLLLVVLANYSNAVITKQQSRSLQSGLRNRHKQQPAPLIEL